MFRDRRRLNEENTESATILKENKSKKINSGDRKFPFFCRFERDQLNIDVQQIKPRIKSVYSGLAQSYTNVQLIPRRAIRFL